MFETKALESALEALGALLLDRSLSYEVVAIGGGSLLLLGLIERPTRDLDLVALVERDQYRTAQPLPLELEQAAKDVARLFRLPEDWLNAGPTMQLAVGLPPGFELRVHRRTYGGLTVQIASRTDQIALKLFAAVYGGPKSKHVSDLRRLAPSRDELAEAARWVKTQDAAPEFPDLVDQVVTALRGTDGE